MLILGIETSCDETALCIIDAQGDTKSGIAIDIRANITLSQIELHRKYGGVFPNLAKREHSKNIIPLLKSVLEKAGLLKPTTPQIRSDVLENIRTLLVREPAMFEQFLEFIPTIEKPAIDAIAVTIGPGLEPALWVGINFAKALNAVWGIPMIPVNHMEGHIFSALLHAEENPKSEVRNPKQILNSKSETPNQETRSYQLKAISFPSLALLISGGHTELILIKGWNDYELIWETRDDAVGEAFDKVARILGLPYPGGPEISTLAEELRSMNYEVRKEREIKLPRPMIKSDDYDFSFSGLKTSVLYLVKKLPELTEEIKRAIALEFEEIG